MSLDVYLICEHCERGVFDANITHNLITMAREADLYGALWCPEDTDTTKARELVPRLTAGLEALRARPTRFIPFNPPNGWGDYDGLVDFVTDYLRACEHFPDARIEVSK